MTLPDAITDAMPPDDNLRIGTVVSTNPVTVLIETKAVPVGCLSSYTPILNDVVAVLRQDSTWLLLGRVATSTNPFLQLQAGAADVDVAAATSATLAQTFAVPFSSVPSVATNISTGAGGVFGWQSRAINVTASGFTIFIFTTGAAGTFTANVQWQAQEMTQ